MDQLVSESDAISSKAALFLNEHRQQDSKIRKEQYLNLAAPKLSIINLMMITAICAVTTTLITSIGFFGVHGILVVCAITNTIAADKLKEQPVTFRFWNQFTWGVLLPIVCIFGDPFVFGSFELGRIVFISTYGYGCYAFVGWQIIVLMASWFIPQDSPRLNSFVAGTLSAGSLFSGIVAVCIFPFTALGILAVGIGLPGIIPWITAFVYHNSAKMHLNRIQNSNDKSIVVIATGFCLPIICALAIYMVAVEFNWQFSTFSETETFEFLLD